MRYVLLLALSTAAAFSQQAVLYRGQRGEVPVGVGSGSGATAVSGLTDCKVTRTSATVLTVYTPCLARVGTTVYTFSSDAVVTLSSGTGTAYIYVAADGTMSVAHNVTLTSCSNCTGSAGTSFPGGSVPLWTWTATSGAWDVSGGTEQRAMLSGIEITAGSNVTVTKTATGYQIAASSSSSSETWLPEMAYKDEGSVSKPGAGFVLGANSSAGTIDYGSGATGITIPALFLANAGTGYFRYTRRLPWALTSLSVTFGVTEQNGSSGDVLLDVTTFCTPFDNSTDGDVITYNTGTPQTITMPALKDSKMTSAFNDPAFITGCVADSMLAIVVKRTPGDAADTYAADLPISGMKIALGH